MPDATRLTTEMGGSPPVTRHYQTPSGYLAVTRLWNFFDNTGTTVYYADEAGAIVSNTPLVSLPDGTTHDEALQALGYTVIDETELGDSDFPSSGGGGASTALPVYLMEILPQEMKDAMIAYYGYSPDDLEAFI